MLKNAMTIALVSAPSRARGSRALWLTRPPHRAGARSTGSLALTTDYIFPWPNTEPRRSSPSGQHHLFPIRRVFMSAFGVRTFNSQRATPAKLESDWSAGLTNTIGKFKYDVGFVYYLSIRARWRRTMTITTSFYGTWPAMISASLSFSAASMVRPTFSGKQGGTIYSTTPNLTVPLPFLPLKPRFSRLGRLPDLPRRRKKVTPDYWDYSAGISFTWTNPSRRISRYIGTSLATIDPWTVWTRMAASSCSRSQDVLCSLSASCDCAAWFSRRHFFLSGTLQSAYRKYKGNWSLSRFPSNREGSRTGF